MLGGGVPGDQAHSARDGRAMMYNNLAVLAIQQQDFAEAAKFASVRFRCSMFIRCVSGIGVP